MTDVTRFQGLRVGAAICGSFCTFEKVFTQLEQLKDMGCTVTPIMSYNAAQTDTRFGNAQQHIERLKKLSGNIILDLTTAEPIGPKHMFDVLIVAPCTGNTLAKLALGITDTPVCLAVKSHLRNQRPVVIGVSTNDALSGASKNIGALRNYRNLYFVPLGQDDPSAKPFSMVADFTKLPETIAEALDGKQIQPMIF